MNQRVPVMKPLYRTKKGTLYIGDSSQILKSKYFKNLIGKINLIFTSPPFALNEKKAYGNLTGEEYIKWLSDFGPIFRNLLAENGSLVIELGNAWEKGSPTMSTLSIQSLLELQKAGGFYLCQEFIWHNTTRLPSPAQWVNVERIRVKDAFTRLWWFSLTSRPKADNRNILKEYSPSMKKLIAKQKYNAGIRPSEHNIGKSSFLKDHKGAIPSNVIPLPEDEDIPSNVIPLPNTISYDPYLNYVRQNGIKYHPARMPPDLAEFFIRFLTEPGDIVLDPFAGSNVTGYVAEKTGRRWRSVELDEDYALSSKARFSSSWLVRPYNGG